MAKFIHVSTGNGNRNMILNTDQIIHIQPKGSSGCTIMLCVLFNGYPLQVDITETYEFLSNKLTSTI